MSVRSLFFGCLVGSWALVSPAQAVTNSIVDQGYAAFYQNELKNFALSNHGTLETSPALTRVAELPGGRVWDAVRAPDGTFYVAVGDSGEVYRVQPDGKKEQVFKAPDPLVRALALDDEGGLFIGVNPSGSIYRLPPGGDRAELWTQVPAAYVWDLRWDDEGLWIATGTPASLMHLPSDAQAGDTPESWGHLDDPEANFTSISRDDSGAFWLGSSPDGVVYYLQGPADGYALYASDAAEVNHVAAFSDGGGLFTTYRSASKKSSSTEEATTADPNSLPPFVVTADDSLGSGNSGSSELYRLTPSGYARPIWRSSSSGIYAMSVVDPHLVLLGLSDGAKLVAFQEANDWALLHQVPGAAEISAILPGEKPSENYVFTSRPAGVWKVGGESDAPAQMTSTVWDADQIASWSRVEVVRSNTLPIKLEVRAGETRKPDSTWSDWAVLDDESSTPTKLVAQLPHALVSRFMQYRLTVDDGKAKGAIYRVRAFYALENVNPSLHSVQVLPFPIEVQENVNRAATNTDLDTLFTARGLQSFVEGEPKTRYKVNRVDAQGWFSVIWKAYDPNGDPLLHDVSLQRTGEDEWMPLAQGLPDPYWTFPVQGLESGYYQIKVESYDGYHDGEDADPYLRAEARSDLFLIDNEAPTLEEIDRKLSGGNATIVIEATDNWSPIANAFYSLDGSPYQPLQPDDGTFDSVHERLTLNFTDFPVGTYHARVEIRDEANQVTVQPVRFEISEAQMQADDDDQADAQEEAEPAKKTAKQEKKKQS
ncbi:MAG: hypothetical protein E1N59_534 [Puniceicoccaceae bacterium 5H]|nr:MAG: hypothetical protein E1N59_534 [Puniceicoccaceae bacterium 5H]